MKNTLIVLLVAAAAAFGALYVREIQKNREARATVAKLHQDVSGLEERVAEQETRAASLQTRLRDTRERVVAKAEEVTHLQEAITNQVEAQSKDKNPMKEMLKGVGEMMKNPQMKEFVKSQQKAALGGMMDKAYASLFTQLGLTADQSAALKDLIVNKSLVDAGTGMSLMSGDVEAADRAQMLEQAKTDKEAIDTQIKQMLGDENYKAFQDYEKTMPERMTIGMFKDQQTAGSTPLTAEQEAQLVQIMGEERQGFKFTTDFSDQSKLTADFAASFTEEKMTQFQQEQEQLHQRYVTRAQTILSTDQLGSFDKFLSSQRQMQSLGLKMASKMFGGAKQENP